MEDSRRNFSRLAVFSLGVSMLWLVVAIAAVSTLFWYPWRDPQGWDKLPLMILLFWGSIITTLISSGTGLAALLHIQRSQGRLAGRSIAIAGIGLPVMIAAILIGLMYL